MSIPSFKPTQRDSVKVFVAGVAIVLFRVLVGLMSLGLVDVIVEVVVSVAHAPATEEGREHDAFVSLERLHLGLQLDKGLLLASELPAPRDVFNFLVVSIRNLIQLIRCFFLLVVQLLHRVYDLTQLHSQMLLLGRDLVQLCDLFLILSIDPFFVVSNLY